MYHFLSCTLVPLDSTLSTVLLVSPYEVVAWNSGLAQVEYT